MSNVIADEGTYLEWSKQTRDMYNYAENIVGSVGPSKCVRVTVSAKNDALIGLGESTDHQSEKYEIFIGEKNNSVTGIRFSNQG